jgi:cell wall-associated NlpC family hydrolase
MNNIKRLLATGILSLTLTGCVTPQASAAEMPNNNVVTKQQNYTTNLLKNYKVNIYNFKLKKNTAKMQEIVMKIFHRVNKTPYVFSGSNTYGWDCSGMVVWMYEHFGITLPHSADKQGHSGKRVSIPKLGDIVVFAYKGSTNFYHSGIYIGKGKIVNSNSYYGTTVIEPLTDYKNSQIRFVRVVPTV